MRRFLIVVAGALAAFACAVIATARPGNPSLYPPPAGERRIPIHIVSHGYHAGVILQRSEIEPVASREGLTGLLSVAIRFGVYDYLEIGWGDEDFYRNAPDLSLQAMPHVLRALFGFNNASALHVVGFSAPPAQVFPQSRMLSITLGETGFARLLDRIDASIGRDPLGGAVFLGPGLYGPSMFVRGVGVFHIASVCNHWVASLLSAAGVPVAPVLATHPAGLFADLLWRGGATKAR